MLNMLYLLTTFLPLPLWCLLIFRPNNTLTRRIVNNYSLFLLMGIYYLILLIAGISTGFDVSAITNLERLARAFGTPIGALIVWTHMLIVDLIAGYWVYHEAQRINATQWIASVCILMTLLSAPIGIFLFVLYRTFKVRNHAL
jgi:hypothetical protein